MSFRVLDFNNRLEEATETYDRTEVVALCDELIVHLRKRDDPFPLDHAKTILKILRGAGYFDLLENAADALIQSGQKDAYVHTMYAQALIDQSKLTAAISVLEQVAKLTAIDGGAPHLEEHIEARGLLGRAYKQLYVLGGDPGRSRNRSYLQTSINYYESIYNSDNSRIWPGINCVALISRADKEGVELDNIAGARLKADQMATEILAEVRRRRQNQVANMWDFATGLEACIRLGLHEEALKWLRRYVLSSNTSAFELGSTYRQLTQVWGLVPGKPPGDEVLPLLKSALLKQKGAEIEITVAESNSEKLEQIAGSPRLEKIFGSEYFKSVSWFERCMNRARSVARIETPGGDPLGTGFVVRGSDLNPGYDDALLLLTNAHVVSDDSRDRATASRNAVARFELRNASQPAEFNFEILWSSPVYELDATLLRTTVPIVGIEPVPIADVLSIGENPRAYIIGHPAGRRLSFSIHDNYILDHDERVLHYRSPTERGSSGSPVFNGEWELIGIHRAGWERVARLNGKEGTYAANEGMRIQVIIEALSSL